MQRFNERETSAFLSINQQHLTRTSRASAFVFEDPKSKELLARLERVARSEATVLIRGETGTGKELIARHLHRLSSRHAGPFIAVNCAALPESLMESELFGHERGAFTSAVDARAGWFEAAQGGTLFLDEIGDIPLSMQVKLLRVLQEREVVRLGARRPMPIDVRLIAATNVNLEDAVKARRFREDLFYRLTVITLTVPPLRERPGDIAPLAMHFLTMYGQRQGLSVQRISPEAMQILQRYPWPGNIRQLEHVIHQAALFCQGETIQRSDLPILLEPPDPPTPTAAPPPTAHLEQALQELFQHHPAHLYALLNECIIRSAYRFCEGNQLRTARLLGISRNIVRDRLLRYRLLNTQRRCERS